MKSTFAVYTAGPSGREHRITDEFYQAFKNVPDK